MRKNLQLDIDFPSWPKAPIKYKKTCPFAANENPASIDFLRAMLWVGVTSIPIQIPRWWLVSQWALLRYVAAVDPASQSLQLRSAVDDLDSHHKTVMSDDWGVGISLQWLASRLGYKYVVHGSSAMRVLQSAGIAQFVKRKKRGPFKCPDFFAVDGKDRFHLIECKGNQKGPAHINMQFARGKQQKQNIRFQNETLVEQRLLAGLAIAGQNSNWASTLKISDPQPNEQESYYNITSETHVPLVEAFKKVLIIQGLLAAGAPRIAHSYFPSETDTENDRVLASPATTRFEAQGTQWEGLTYELTFPTSLRFGDGSTVGRSRMRFGASVEFLTALNAEANRNLKKGIVSEISIDLADDSGYKKLGGPRNSANSPVRKDRMSHYAVIRQGKAFLADFELLET